ncbi:uncharacterized protein LOC110713117 isoform X4 [Chenopodium quinoa]|uniref:uncharacterized protein LOC110713117 isoform X4 n=1 Tax=Chenopodium quinoa TaxID=63459 RepID=UPI000B7999DF|nr:uncharacterized protein LOC110713117 isoform X4 [Chenopodium quinoa]
MHLFEAEDCEKVTTNWLQSLKTHALGMKKKRDRSCSLEYFHEGKVLERAMSRRRNFGRNWMLAVISPWNGIVYWLDPGGADTIPEFAKTVINEGIKQFSAFHRKDIKKIKKDAYIGWKQPKCPSHPKHRKDYGYFLCRYMLEILEKRVLWITDKVFTQEAYSLEEIDEIRDIWVEYLLKQLN